MDSTFSAHINRLVADFSTQDPPSTYKNAYDFLRSLSHHIAGRLFDSQPQTEVSLDNLSNDNASEEDNGWILIVSNGKESIVVDAHHSNDLRRDLCHPNPHYKNDPQKYQGLPQNCTNVIKIRMRLNDIEGHKYYTVT